MHIELLSPVNNACVNLMPKIQNELLNNLPTKNQIIENGYDWENPTASNSDNSRPEFVIFTWRLEGNLSCVTDISLFLSDNADFENPEIHEISPGQMLLSLTNFTKNQYFWKMVAFCDEEIICVSNVFSFTVAETLPRWYYVKGSTNIRDIGGIKAQGNKKVKYGMLYRGSELDSVFEANKTGLKFMQEKLKIKTDLDLRKATDLNKEQSSPIPDATLINIPVLAYADVFTDSEKEKYGKIFKLLSDESNYPLYVHCIAGADRTGTVVAILLCLLGVEWDDVATEYEYTNLSVFRMRSRYQKFFYDFRKALEEYGDTPATRAENYLLSCGVNREEIDKIRHLLLKGE